MDALLLIARLALAGVFALAGIGKMLDLKGSQKAVRDFGVPERFAAIAGLALPVLELVVALFLLPTGTARDAALLGFLLMGAFVGAMIWNLRQGRAPDCHCFGQFHSEPISPMTIARNGVIALVALFVVIAGWNDAGYSLLGWTDELSGFEWMMLVIGLVLIAGLAAMAWFVLHLLGQNGRLLLRLDEIEEQLTAVSSGSPINAVSSGNGREPKRVAGLPVGTPAPAFNLQGLHGESMSLDALVAGSKPVLLVFSDPKCGPCTTLMPEVANWQQDHTDRFLTAIISRGDLAANQAKASELGLGMVFLQNNREVAEAYKSAGTPSAVVVDPDGKIASPVAEGTAQIKDLVASIVATPERQQSANPPAKQPSTAGRPVPSPAIGTSAPDIELKDLDGNPVLLSTVFTRETVLVFWSPTCGFCKRMVSELREWERSARADQPQAVIVTSGTAEENRQFGFSSTLLLDPGARTMKLYGTTGTPTGIKVDVAGRIASDLRVGQPGVMSLLRNEAAPASRGSTKAVDVGSPAPAVNLPDLNGEQFDLASKKGRQTAVIFWNPTCGFCRRMADDLKQWEESRPEGTPDLVLVSTGSIEANAAPGFTSPVLIDQGFTTGRSFGASGTPSAVLIDETGNVASGLAVGAPGVFELIGRPAN